MAEDEPHTPEPLIDSEISVPVLDTEDNTIGVTSYNYSDRAPSDWIVSGPLTGFTAIYRGREFDTVKQAEEWCRWFYGPRFKRMWITPQPGMWSALIREKGDVNAN